MEGLARIDMCPPCSAIVRSNGPQTPAAQVDTQWEARILADHLELSPEMRASTAEVASESTALAPAMPDDNQHQFTLERRSDDHRNGAPSGDRRNLAHQLRDPPVIPVLKSELDPTPRMEPPSPLIDEISVEDWIGAVSADRSLGDGDVVSAFTQDSAPERRARWPSDRLPMHAQ